MPDQGLIHCLPDACVQIEISKSEARNKGHAFAKSPFYVIPAEAGIQE
jgi:hypothetical protein